MDTHVTHSLIQRYPLVYTNLWNQVLTLPCSLGYH